MKKIMDKAILTSAFILGAMKVGTTDAQARHVTSDDCDKGCDQVKHQNAQAACRTTSCTRGCMIKCARTGEPLINRTPSVEKASTASSR